MAQIKWGGTSGDWATKADWVGGVEPTSTDDAVIAATGTYTVTIDSADVAKSLTVNDAGATVAVNSGGTLTLGSTLSLTAGMIDLNSGGTISGGALSAAGGAFHWLGGTLDGVTYDGTLDLSPSASSLYVTSKGLVMKGAGGTGAGTIDFDGFNCSLYFQGKQTLDNATVDLGDNAYDDYLYSQDTGAGAVLTLGAGLTIDHTGTAQIESAGSNTAGDGVINKGTIDAALNGASLLINPYTFTNEGTIAVSGGDTVTLSPGTFDNTTGKITVDKTSTVKLESDFTTAQLGSIASTGTVDLTSGTLSNTGKVLTVGGGSALGSLTVGAGGMISGGTISDTGSGIIGGGGTLDGVTYDGTLDLSPSASSLYVTSKGLVMKGAGGTGAGTIDFDGFNCSLYFQGKQTLDNATVDLGDNAYDDYLYSQDTGAGAVLTLGAGLTIDHTGTAQIESAGSNTAGDGVINKGTIDAALNGASLLINPYTFTNEGTIAVSGGDTVTLSPGTFDNTTGKITVDKTSTVKLESDFTTAQLGSIASTGTVDLTSGTLSNTGKVLTVGGGSALGSLTVGAGGMISGGTISDTGSGIIGGGGTLDGVTYDGTLDLSPSASSLYVTSKGLVMKGAGGTGAGTIDFDGFNCSLYFQGKQTLDNATVDLGDNAYDDYLYSQDTGAGAVLTLGAGLTIDHTGTAQIESAGSNTAGDGVINKGTIDAALNGASLLINPYTFTNEGTIAVSGGDTVTLSPGTFDNTTGKITVDKTSTVKLESDFTTAQLGSIASTGTVDLTSGTLSNTGKVLTVGGGSALGSLTVGAGGMISGGTISDTGSGIIGGGGTLDGVTYDGTLDLSPSASSLYVTSKGLVMKGAGGTGAGTIDFDGFNCSLYFQGKQTLDNATVDLGDNAYDDYLYSQDTGAGAVLTLGAGLTIDHTGTAQIESAGSNTAGDGVINKGTIDAALNGASLLINPYTFTNEGTIAVSGGDTVTLSPGTFDNTTGKITVDKTSTVKLESDFTTAQLGSIASTGTVDLTSGTLSNTGKVLTVGGGSALGSLTVGAGGMISGGTISDTGSGIIGGGGTLDGVTYDGTLDLSPSASSLYVTSKGLVMKGAGGTGAGTIDFDGFNCSLYFQGKQTLDNATVDLGDNAYDDYLYSQDTGAGAVLTLGAGLTIDHTGTAQIESAGSNTAGDGVINKGTIDAALNGGHLLINPLAFTNAGTIAVSGGDTVTFDCSVNDAAGTLSVGANSTVDFGNGSTLSIEGTLSNAGTINFQSSASATSLHVLTNGLTLTGGGTIDLTGRLDRIYGVAASATLTNVNNTIAGAGFIGQGEMTLVNEAGGVINADGAGGIIINTAGRTLTNAGLIEASNGVVLVIAGTTVNNAGGVIEALKGRVDLQTADIIGGALTATSSGIFETNTSGGVLNGVTQAVTLSGRLGIINGTNLTIEGAVVNQGTIILGGAGKVTDLAIGAGGATLSGSGLIEMSDVTFNHIDSAAAATLTNLNDRIFGAGTIGNANLTLVNDAAGVIASNSGTALTLDTGANTIMNAGDIEGGNGTGGVIVQGAVDNTGRLIALKGNLTVNGAVTGAGTATINAGIMSFGSAFSENVTFSAATGELVLAQSRSYAATISGFSKTGGTSLVLKDIGFVKASEATFSGGVLTVTDGAHTAHIHLSGNYTGVTFTASADGAGVMVVASSTAPAARTNFISAMASFAASPSAASAPARSASANLIPLLAPPAAHIAA